MATVFAVIAILSSFDSALIAGPSFVVSTPAVDASPFIVEHTPTSVDSFGLRAGWNTASALILIGCATLLFALGQAGRRAKMEPFFADQIQEFLAIRLFITLGLVGFGGLLREFLRGRIREAAGIAERELSSDDDFDLFVFDLPFLLLLAAAMLIGWVFNQGIAAQDESEGVV